MHWGHHTLWLSPVTEADLIAPTCLKTPQFVLRASKTLCPTGLSWVLPVSLTFLSLYLLLYHNPSILQVSVDIELRRCRTGTRGNMCCTELTPQVTTTSLITLLANPAPTSEQQSLWDSEFLLDYSWKHSIPWDSHRQIPDQIFHFPCKGSYHYPWGQADVPSSLSYLGWGYLEATWSLLAWIRFPPTHCVLVSEIRVWGNYLMVWG